jgi:hypothetical protein
MDAKQIAVKRLSLTVEIHHVSECILEKITLLGVEFIAFQYLVTYLLCLLFESQTFEGCFPLLNILLFFCHNHIRFHLKYLLKKKSRP